MQSPIKLFVCEFITGGGFHHTRLPVALLKEGRLMRDALLKDLASQLCDVFSAYDARLTPPKNCYRLFKITATDDVWQVWENIIRQVDAVWCIAPETDSLLEKLTALAAQYGKIVIGSDCRSIHVASDKLLTYQALLQANIATIPTYYPYSIKKSTGRWVTKPRYGAGCELVYYFDDRRARNTWIDTDENINQYIAQPFQAGEHASISCLMSSSQAFLLSCNKQNIKLDKGMLRAEGILINGMKAYWSVFEQIANHVAQAIDGLSGYVGIDVIVTAEKVVVVEINPRLTTSYIGLQEATGINPAARCLQIALKKDIDDYALTKNVVSLNIAQRASDV